MFPPVAVSSLSGTNPKLARFGRGQIDPDCLQASKLMIVMIALVIKCDDLCHLIKMLMNKKRRYNNH